MPGISLAIVIPVYNAEKYLAVALDSVLLEELPGGHLYLVDDGSKDGSLAICQDYAARHPNITVISQPNAGPSAARNAALALVTEEYVTFLDADDCFESGTLLAACNYLAANPTDVLFLRMKRISSNGTTSYTVKYEKEKRLTGDELRSLWCRNDKRVRGFFGGKIYTRKLLENITFPEDMRFAEDMYSLSDLLAKVKSATFFPTGSYNYFERENTPTTSNWTEQKSFQLQKAYLHRWQLAMSNTPPLADQIAAWRLCLELFIAERKIFPQANWIPTNKAILKAHPFSLWQLLTKGNGFIDFLKIIKCLFII